MGMLMHNTLMEQENAMKRNTKAEKPVEVPKENEPDEPVRKTGGRRKTSK